MTLSKTAFFVAASLLSSSSLALAAGPSCAQTRDLFTQKCSMCHGQDGKGYSAIGTPDFTSAKWQKAHPSNEALENVIKKGKGSMPAFDGILPEAQIDALVKCAVRGFGEKKKQ